VRKGQTSIKIIMEKLVIQATRGGFGRVCLNDAGVVNQNAK
jgi:hypothetical protein